MNTEGVNTEERIRQQLHVEAEQLRAPEGSIDAAVRRGSRRRATRFIAGSTLAIALVAGTGVIAAIANSGTTPPEDDQGITAAIQEETTGSSSSTDLSPGSGATLGAVDYSWEEVVLPNTTAFYGPAPLVAAGNGILIAAASVDSGEPSTKIFTSADGHDWQQVADIPVPFVELLTATERGFIASGQSFTPEGNAVVVATSADGTNWTTTSIPIDSFQSFSVTAGAGSDESYVVAGTAWDDVRMPPVDLPEAGVTILEEGAVIRVLDFESGALQFETASDVIYGFTEGMVLRNPDTGDPIVTIPYEAIDAAYATDQYPPVVQFEGYALELHDDGRFVATELATGTVYAGMQEDLYRPPRLTIVHPETGEVVVDVSWDVWDEAQNRAFERQTDTLPRSEIRVLSSTDGANWTDTSIDVGEWTAVSLLGLAHAGDRFLAFADVWDTQRNEFIVLDSIDGVNWTMSTSPSDIRSVSNVVPWRDGIAAVTYDGDGPQLATSNDGVDWDLGPSLDRDVAIQGVWAGNGSLLGFGTTSPSNVDPSISVTVDGKEMTLDPELGLVTVVDQATGEVLARIEFDPYAEEPPSGIELTLDGFAVLNEDGETVFVADAATIEQAYESVAAQYEDYFAQIPVVIIYDGEEWLRATTAGLLVGYPRSAVSAPNGAVVLTGEPTFAESFRGDGSSGAEETAPLTLEGESSGIATVWVGVPAGR